WMSRRRIAAGNVGVSQLVDEKKAGVSMKRCIQVELLSNDAAITHWQRGQFFQPIQKPLCFCPTMRLNVTHYDINSGGTLTAGGFQHGVRLTDAGTGSEEDAQTTTFGARLLSLHLRKQAIRIWPDFSHGNLACSESSLKIVQSEVQLQHIDAQ